MSSSVKKIEDVLRRTTQRTILIRVDEICLHPQRNKVKHVRGCILVVMYKDDVYFMWVPYALLVNIDSNLCVYLRKDNTLVTEHEFQEHLKKHPPSKEKKKNLGVVNTPPSSKYVSAQLSIGTPAQLLDRTEGEFVNIEIQKRKAIEEEEKDDQRYDERYYTNEQLFAMCHPIMNINSLKRFLPDIGWSHLIVTLNNAISQSPLYFHDGGMNYFFQELRKHVTLQRTSIDPDLFLVNSVTSPLKTSLKEIGFDSYFEDVYQKKWNFLEIGSQITKTARNLKNQFLGSTKKKNRVVSHKQQFPHSESEKQQQRKPAEQLPPQQLTPGNDDFEDDFVIIESNETRIRREVQERWDGHEKRMLTRERWMKLYFDSDTGRVKNMDELRRDVFYGGIAEMELRKEIWPFLLGFFDANSTFEERVELVKKKDEEYQTIKSQWMSITEEQKEQFTMFRNREAKIEKDVIRTDRNYVDYEDEKSPWLKILNDILMTYMFYNFDLGYCQGMNDLVAPILTIMRDESLSFWCFVHLMKMVGKNFMKDSENGIDLQLKQLGHVIRNLDLKFYTYLEERGAAPDLFFCFRWMLVMFKREFPFLVVIRLWEAIISVQLELKHPVRNGFNGTIFVAYGILHNELKKEILEKRLEGDEIFKYVIDKQMKFDVITSLRDGEFAYEHYKRHLEVSEAKEGVLF